MFSTCTAAQYQLPHTLRRELYFQIFIWAGISPDILSEILFKTAKEETNILHMRKQWLRSAWLISPFAFAARIVQFLFFLNPKFPASVDVLCLYSLVYV